MNWAVCKIICAPAVTPHQCLTNVISATVCPLTGINLLLQYNLKLTEIVAYGLQWLLLFQFNSLCSKSWESNVAAMDNITLTLSVTWGRHVRHRHISDCASLHLQINKRIHSCSGLGLFFLFSFSVCALFTVWQLVSVTATASVSTRACARSARTWQPADTARAASPASTEIRPTGAAASVSIRRGRSVRH